MVLLMKPHGHDYNIYTWSVGQEIESTLFHWYHKVYVQNITESYIFMDGMKQFLTVKIVFDVFVAYFLLTCSVYRVIQLCLFAV